MTYLGDPTFFQNVLPGSVTFDSDGPLWGNSLIVPGGLTFEHVTPGLTYGGCFPPHYHIEQTPPLLTPEQIIEFLARLGTAPEQPVQAVPEPIAAPTSLPRRRAMQLDGDIPTGA